MEGLEQYRIAVESYAARNVDYLFHNEGNEHALIILTNIFANAKDHIRIAANRLYNDEVVNTEAYVNAIKAFLDKGDTRLSVIITKRPEVDEVRSQSIKNTLYWMLFNHTAYDQKRVVIKDGDGKSFYDSKDQRINFCTGDGMMYRLEDDIERRKAVANFGDPAATGKLESMFDSVFEGLKEVHLNDYYKTE